MNMDFTIAVPENLREFLKRTYGPQVGSERVTQALDAARTVALRKTPKPGSILTNWELTLAWAAGMFEQSVDPTDGPSAIGGNLHSLAGAGVTGTVYLKPGVPAVITRLMLNGSVTTAAKARTDATLSCGLTALRVGQIDMFRSRETGAAIPGYMTSAARNGLNLGIMSIEPATGIEYNITNYHTDDVKIRVSGRGYPIRSNRRLYIPVYYAPWVPANIADTAEGTFNPQPYGDFLAESFVACTRLLATNSVYVDMSQGSAATRIQTPNKIWYTGDEMGSTDAVNGQWLQDGFPLFTTERQPTLLGGGVTGLSVTIKNDSGETVKAFGCTLGKPTDAVMARSY